MELLNSATEAIRGVLSPSRRERAKEKAAALRESLGEGLCLCIVGSGDEATAAAAARQVAGSLGAEANYVTLGQPGAQQSFLAACPPDKVFQLIPHWAVSGLAGVDLPGGSDLEECESICGYLADAILVLADAPQETLTVAAEKGVALVPVFAGTPAPTVLPERAPWFATQEQWQLLLDPVAPVDKVAAACASVVTTFGAHHKAVAEPENCDELCYADPDAERWAQLAETGAKPPPDVTKGNLRLQGSFSGKATTHSHQMDVNIGVDFEMPSKVAAKTMKQLSDSGITLPEEAEEALAQPRRSVFGSLADYFRKDGEAANQPDVTAMIVDSMQLKLDEVHAVYAAQQKQLQEELAAAHAKVKEQKEQLDGLEGSQLLAKLQEDCKELHAATEKESAAKARLATALAEAEAAMEAKAQERAALQAENGDLRAGLARLQGEVEALMTDARQAKDAEELERQIQSLKQQVALAEAKARDAKRRLEELEASSSELAGREAEATTRSFEIGEQLRERAEENERLQAEGLELREMLAKITASERRLSDTVAQLTSQLEKPEGKRTSEEELSKLQAKYKSLQAEHEKCLRSVDNLRGEGANRQEEMSKLQLSCQQLRREVDQAKTSLVAETAGKASAVAQLAQERESVASLRKSLAEQQQLVAQIGEQSAGLAAKVQDLEKQLKHAEGSKNAERDSEVTRLKSQSAGQVRESEELRKQLKQAVDEQQQAHEKAKVWQQHVQDAQDKLADLTLELETLRRSRDDEREAAALQPEATDDLEATRSIDWSAVEERQMRARPGASRSVIVRRSVGPLRSAPLNTVVGIGSPGVPPPAFKSMAVPMPAQATQTQTLPARSTGKVTHVGTTTTFHSAEGNYSVFTPATEASGSMPAPAAKPGTVSLPMPSAPIATMPAMPALATSVQMPTAAGLIHGQVGLQVGNIRRIR